MSMVPFNSRHFLVSVSVKGVAAAMHAVAHIPVAVIVLKNGRKRSEKKTLLFYSTSLRIAISHIFVRKVPEKEGC